MNSFGASYLSGFAPAVVVGAATILAVHVGVPYALTYLGFTAAGVQAGSLAAATQATIGNVASGSLFAM